MYWQKVETCALFPASLFTRSFLFLSLLSYLTQIIIAVVVGDSFLALVLFLLVRKTRSVGTTIRKMKGIQAVLLSSPFLERVSASIFLFFFLFLFDYQHVCLVLSKQNWRLTSCFAPLPTSSIDHQHVRKQQCSGWPRLAWCTVNVDLSNLLLRILWQPPAFARMILTGVVDNHRNLRNESTMTHRKPSSFDA